MKDKVYFDQQSEDILKKLGEKNFIKTINYLNNILVHKHKWANAYLPIEFTGGVHTTNRGESMNSLMKRYIDSTSEMSDMIKFLEDYEKKSFLKTVVSKKVHPNSTKNTLCF